MSKRSIGIVKFEKGKVRRHWDENKELWYFSVVDIVGVLTESGNPRKYWNKLSQRLRDEGSQSVTNCHQLKLKASDGKKYLTDVAEVTTKEISKKNKPSTFDENKDVAQKGGKIAGDTRKDIEKELGRDVVTKDNANELVDGEKKKLN